MASPGRQCRTGGPSRDEPKCADRRLDQSSRRARRRASRDGCDVGLEDGAWRWCRPDRGARGSGHGGSRGRHRAGSRRRLLQRRAVCRSKSAARTALVRRQGPLRQPQHRLRHLSPPQSWHLGRRLALVRRRCRGARAETAPVRGRARARARAEERAGALSPRRHGIREPVPRRSGRGGPHHDWPSGYWSPAREQLPPGLDNVLAVQAMFPVISDIEMAGHKGENAIEDASADIRSRCL